MNIRRQGALRAVLKVAHHAQASSWSQRSFREVEVVRYLYLSGKRLIKLFAHMIVNAEFIVYTWRPRKANDIV